MEGAKRCQRHLTLGLPNVYKIPKLHFQGCSNHFKNRSKWIFCRTVIWSYFIILKDSLSLYFLRTRTRAIYSNFPRGIKLFPTNLKRETLFIPKYKMRKWVSHNFWDRIYGAIRVDLSMEWNYICFHLNVSSKNLIKGWGMEPVKLEEKVLFFSSFYCMRWLGFYEVFYFRSFFWWN